MVRDYLKNSKVLVVDDNSTNLGLVYEYLSKNGLIVLLAQDGESALELVNSEKPDLVLLDIVMPGIDGFEVCKRITTDPKTKNIPVIFMSALSDIVDKVRGFEAGGVDYITKPLSQPEVMVRVTSHLTIKKQREELIALNADKDKFFSIIAHDLKNPFFNLLGFTEYLSENSNSLRTEEISEVSRDINSSARSVFNLLENLLNWARLKTGGIEYHPINFNLKSVADNVIELNLNGIDSKNINVYNNIDSDAEAFGDINMIETVLRNLFSNSLKFSNIGGKIELNAELHHNEWEVRIKDTGIGMNVEELHTIFNINNKVSREGTKGERGTGLGLLLCREFVEKNGGKIWAESEPNKWSEFHFTIKAAQ